MGKETRISWCDSTFNLAWGCVEASDGCTNCYAKTLAHRYGFEVWGPGSERRVFGDKHWAEPLKWNAAAAAAGTVHRVFSSSMTDNFLNDPIIAQERSKLWPLIKATPALEWLLLTKHPERFAATIPDDMAPNVRLGVSVENTENGWRADAARSYAVYNRGLPFFISAEPLLGSLAEVDFTGAGWVIVGGESGPHARPMNLDWVREIRDRCAESGTPFLLKQLGGYPDARGHEKALLDGREHTAFPVKR